MRPIQEKGPQERGDYFNPQEEVEFADVLRCAGVLERVLSRRGTRAAWIMGFLVGSSLATGADVAPAVSPV